VIIYPNLYRPEIWQEVEGDTCELLLSAAPYVDQREVMLFGPYKLIGPKREDSSVSYLTEAVLDFDGVGRKPNRRPFTPDELTSLLDRLSAFSGMLYSTYSHDWSDWRFRAVLRMTRPVHRSQWGAVWEKIRGTFPELDRSCKDASRGYYLHTIQTGRHSFRFPIHGKVFDPDADYHYNLIVDDHTAPLPVEVLQRVAKSWWRSRDLHKARLAEVLRLALDGLPYAVEGERDEITWQLISALTRELQNVSIEGLAATLRPSNQAMGQDDKYLQDKIPDMVFRARENARKASETQTLEPVLSSRSREYLSALNEPDPKKALVLQYDSDYWVMSFSEEHGFWYVPCKRESLVRQASDKLAPFGVSLVTLDGEKSRKLKPEEIVSTFGMPIEGVVRSWEYDEPDIRRSGALRELVLPATRKRLDEPEYSEEVDRWLRLLGGEHVATLFQWLALATTTTEPLAALMLIGGSGTGKSLLPKELSKIWTSAGPPALQKVFSQFDDDMLRCPVVLADEDLPRDNRGAIRSAEFRELISTGIHRINAKNKALQTLEGYPRIVVTGNQIPQIGGDDLTHDDLTAIQNRLLVITTPHASAEYLCTVDVGRWIRQDAIGKHVLWLANQGFRRTGRFGVDTKSTYVPDKLLASGLRSAILEWIAKHVLYPDRCGSCRSEISGGSVGVRLADIEANWQIYVGTTKPRTDKLARASRLFEESAIGYVVVSIADLKNWAKTANYCSEVELDQAIAAFKKPNRLSIVR
jgi:hypothetical protein